METVSGRLTPARALVSYWGPCGPPKLYPHVAAIGPTQVRKRFRERRKANLLLGIIFVARHEHADAPHPVSLLRTRYKRLYRRAPEPCDEFPPSHSPSPALFGAEPTLAEDAWEQDTSRLARQSFDRASSCKHQRRDLLHDLFRLVPS
jgi:hypothetical protein